MEREIGTKGVRLGKEEREEVCKRLLHGKAQCMGEMRMRVRKKVMLREDG